MNMHKTTTRRRFLRQASLLADFPFCDLTAFATAPLPGGVARVIEQFVAEARPDGGVDKKNSIWQKPGHGAVDIQRLSVRGRRRLIELGGAVSDQ